MQDLELLHRSQLQSVQVMKAIVADVEHLEALETEEASRVPVVVQLAKQRVKPVLLDVEDAQVRQVAEGTQTGERVVVQVELAEVRARLDIEHLLEVAQLAAIEVELLDVLEGERAETLLENLWRESTCEGLLGLEALGVLHTEAVEDAQSSQVEDTVDAVVFDSDQVVARDVQDDEALQFLQVYDLFDLVNLVVTQVELHQRLHVFEAIQSLDLVVLETQLSQALQVLDVCDGGDPVLAEIELLEVFKVREVLDHLYLILLKRQLFQ